MAKRFRVLLVVLTSAMTCLGAGPETSTLRGRITDLGGEPLKGAVVAAARCRGQGPTGSALYTTKTDLSGNYRFTDLSAGTYCVRAETPGWSAAELNLIAVLPNSTTVADLGLSLEAAGPSVETTVSGRVIEASGPVDDVTVTIEAALNPGIRFQVRSEAGGRFRFRMTHFVWLIPEGGHYILSAHKAGFTLAVHPLFIRHAGDDQEAELLLSRTLESRE